MSLHSSTLHPLSFPTRRSSDLGAQTKDHIMLTEMVRAALNRSISKTLLNDQSELAVVTLSPQWEERLNHSIVRGENRKSTRLNSSHRCISYAVFCLKKKTKTYH